MPTLLEIYQAHSSPKSKPVAPGPQAANKYKNRRVVIDGINFQSTGEGIYYTELKLLMGCGKIKGFKRQVPFTFIVNGVTIGKYVADFCVLNNDLTIEVVDHKSKFTADFDLYKIKKKLMLACYGVVIKEVTAK